MSENAQTSNLRVSIEAGAKLDDINWVNQRLADYAVQTIGRNDYVPLTVFLRDEANQLRGGLLGYTIWSAMQIDSFWVDEEVRRQGHGRALLAAAERAARIRGCKLVHLETYSELARQFYERSGFVVFGQLGIDDGLTRYYLSKSLKDDGETSSL